MKIYKFGVLSFHQLASFIAYLHPITPYTFLCCNNYKRVSNIYFGMQTLFYFLIKYKNRQNEEAFKYGF